MSKLKLSYYVVTVFLTVLMLISAGMYVFNHEELSATFLK